MTEIESNQYLQLILDSTPDGITVQRRDGSLLYANTVAAELLGYDSPEALINSPIEKVISGYELLDEEGNPFPLARLPGRLALQGQHPEDALICFRRLNNNEVHWSTVRARPVFDRDGALLFVVNTFRYVTDHMQALQAEREIRLRAEEMERHLSFLARSGEILAQSLNYEITLQRVAQLVVPDIADWCAVDICLGDPERVAVAHVDPVKVELAYELERRFPADPDAETGLYNVLRTGEPEIYPDITNEMDLKLQSIENEEDRELLRQLELRSLIIVPLKAGDRVLGALTLACAESGRHFTEKDLLLASELARRAATAVDNARLYAEAKQLNEQLEERVARRTAALRQSNGRLQTKIEEVQATEERLRRGEMQLAEAQRIAHLGSWEWAIKDNCFAWSEELYRIFGLAPQSIRPSYDEFLARVHPEDRERVAQAIDAARKRAIPFSMHHRLVVEDGSVRTVHAQGTVETDGHGTVLRIVGTSQNVTMQKEIEEELRRSEALYQAIAENLPNGAVFVVDRELRYQLARGPGLEVAGYSDWEGKTIWDVVPADRRDVALQRYQKALAGEASTEEVHGDNRIVSLQTVPLTNAEGDIYAALTLMQDVTEHREAEETTRRLLKLSRKLNATLNIDGMLETLAESAIQLTNADGSRVQLAPSDLLEDGTSTEMGAGPTGEAETVLRMSILDVNGDALGFLEVRKKHSESQFTETDQEKLAGLAQIASIALQNALSFQRLRMLSQKAVSAQEQERRYLSRELHDSTGQLLMALKMSLSMIQSEMSERDSDLVAQLEEVRELVDTVYDEIRAVSHALRPPSLDVIGVDEALNGLCEDYGRHSGMKIEYVGCDTPELPENVSISLYRLLQEALTNVAKHAQANKVEVILRLAKNKIELSVHDDGIGFNVREVLRRHHDRGVGLLGLRERFELLGGAVHIDSRPGKGTRIAGSFRLPRKN